METLEKVSAKPALLLSTKHSLCPGCGEPLALRTILELVEELGLRERTVCVCGDGSIQWNIQELLTISRYRLPIKIFVFNNQGYASIRATQNSFFEGRFVGADHPSGLANPDFRKLAEAYGLGYSHIANNAALEAGLMAALSDDQPAICELNLAKEQIISPKASAFRRPDGTFESRPLEDMAPFLPREEVHENMHLFDEENEVAR